MDGEWLRMSVRGIASVCVVVAVAECAADDGEHAGGLRFLCGAAVAAAVLKMAAQALKQFF